MNIKKKLLAAMVSVGLAFGLCPALAVADDSAVEPADTSFGVQVVRIAGETSAQTSAAISHATYETSLWVVLARDDDFADAMSATGLAGALNAPIVLTDRGGLSDSARAEIQRLGVKACYIIGGEGAMSSSIDSELTELGISASRVAGKTAADTSVVCANQIAQVKQAAGQPLDKAIIAMSANFQDALSISSFAYAYGVPIFLQTDGATAADRALTPEAQAQLTGTWSAAQVYVPGGVGALSEASVEGVVGASRVTRMFGDTGYDTSAAIAKRLTEDGLLSADNVYFACGAQASKGLDALSGAALVGKNKGVILLTNTNTVMEPVNAVTQYGFFANHATSVLSATILGGSYVVPEAQKQVIQEILNGTFVHPHTWVETSSFDIKNGNACNGCGQDLDLIADFDEHTIDHHLAGEANGWHTHTWFLTPVTQTCTTCGMKGHQHVWSWVEPVYYTGSDQIMAPGYYKCWACGNTSKDGITQADYIYRSDNEYGRADSFDTWMTGINFAATDYIVSTKSVEAPTDSLKLQSIGVGGPSSLGVGDTANLFVSYTPSNTTSDRAVTWSSDNPSVISVDQAGVVTSHAEGTATITATSISGCKATSFMRATTENIGNVTSTKLFVNGIDASTGTINLTYGKSYPITLTTNPGNAVYVVGYSVENYPVIAINGSSSKGNISTWSWENGYSFTDPSSSVLANKRGSATLLATVTDKNGNKLEARAAVTVV